MKRLYTNRVRPDLPKLRNASISGLDVDFLRYDPNDSYPLFHCNSIQRILVVDKGHRTCECWYKPNIRFVESKGKQLPHPFIELIGDATL
jgi:hypothetical protein